MSGVDATPGTALGRKAPMHYSDGTKFEA